MSHGHHGGGGVSGGGGHHHASHAQSVSHHASHAQSASHHASHAQSASRSASPRPGVIRAASAPGRIGRMDHHHHHYRMFRAFGPSYYSYGPRYGYRRLGCSSLIIALVVAIVILSVFRLWWLFIPIVAVLVFGSVLIIMRLTSRNTTVSGVGTNYQPPNQQYQANQPYMPPNQPYQYYQPPAQPGTPYPPPQQPYAGPQYPPSQPY